MKTWSFAVVGCGTVADFHIQAIRELEHARLVMVAGRTEERVRKIGIRENCAWTTDLTEVLNHQGIDIVCLTTPSGTHAFMGVEILSSGKHLLVEKPLAMTAAEAQQLIRTAEEFRVTLSVVSQRRFEAQHREAKRVLEEGGLGKLLLIEATCPFYRTQEYYDSSSWRGTIEQDGGALMNQGIHSIDLMLWLGGPVRSVFGKTATATHRIEAEDLGLAMVQFESGAYGTITASTSIQPGFQPTLNLYGEKGTIKVQGTSVVHWSAEGYPLSREEEGSTGGGVSDPMSISALYHRLQIADLLEALNTGRKPQVTGEDGWLAVRLVEYIYRSSAEGKEITLSDWR